MTTTETRSAIAGFAEFYAATFHHVAAQLYAYLGDHAEAQDLTQEAFCRPDPSGWILDWRGSSDVSLWELAGSRWVERFHGAAGPLSPVLLNDGVVGHA